MKLFACLTLIAPVFSFAAQSATYLSFFYNSSVTSSFDYKNQEYKRNGLSIMLGFEGIEDKGGLISGGGIFIGGGALGSDIAEFILGAGVRSPFWLLEDRIAIPISLDIAWRWQSAYISNMLVAAFIDEPKFLLEPESYLKGKRYMSRHNFDIMPALDLQFYLTNGFSVYAGYMYRIAFSGDWKFEYRIPGKSYVAENGGKTPGDEFTVPEEFNPMKDSKERIFGVPGTLRFGLKIHQ